jgi:hypothetical protein
MDAFTEAGAKLESDIESLALSFIFQEILDNAWELRK